MALGDWSKRKRTGWLIAATLVAILIGCGIAEISGIEAAMRRSSGFITIVRDPAWVNEGRLYCIPSTAARA
jgi:hypothetical protein